MDKKILKIQHFGTLISSFMSEIASIYRNQSLDDTIDALLAYLADLYTNTSYDKLYEKIYEKISGTPGKEDLYLNEEELFTLVIELCALHIYDWTFRMKEVLTILLAMRYNPENHVKEIAIWKELVNAIQ